jgi:DamX protein
MTSDDSQLLSINMLTTDEAPVSDDARISAHAASSARRTQLKVAMQLLQTAGHVVVVQGEPGMGKSDFLLGLQQRLPDTLHPGFIAASGQLDLANLLMALGATGDDARLRAIDLLHAVHQEEMWPVLLIDHADQLNDATLKALLSLWSAAQDEGIAFSVVLSGPLGFSKRLPAMAHLQQRLHVINLYPLSEQQTVDYLAQRLDSMGQLSGSRLSATQMRTLYVRTQGIPARIDDEIRQLLTSPPSPRPAVASGRRTITLVSVAVLALVGALVATLGLIGFPEERLSQPEIIPLPASAAALAQAEPRIADELPPPQALDAEPAPETSLEPALPGPPAPVAPQTALADEGIADQGDDAETVDAEPDIAPAPADQPPAPDLAIAASTPPTADDWLHSRSAGAFTIQLVAAQNPDALRQFMEQHQLGDEAALLRLQRNGRAWYVVVFGDYPSRAASRAALQQLPAAVRKDGAWARSFGELQQLAK